MCPQASPEPDMTIQVTDLDLKVGRIVEAADVLVIDDLRAACEFVLSAAGRSHKGPLPSTQQELREILIDAVEFLRESHPEKLTGIVEFLDGVVRTRFRESLANSQRPASHSA